MNTVKYLSLVIFSFSLFFLSCKDKSTFEEVDIDLGMDYYPLVIGKYISYKLDSVVYDVTGTGSIAINSSIFLKEEVVDSLRDNEGRLSYRIERSVKQNLSDPWVIKDVWITTQTETRVERVEENLRFIKMTFPISQGTVWDGNLFIDSELIIPIAGESIEIYKNWSYEFDKVGQPEMISDFNFDEVTTVFQSNNENLIELRFSQEKYAKGIGLVYKEMQILDRQCGGDISNCDGLTWEETADKGFVLRQTIIDHN